METLTLVTAVSRAQNLRKIYSTISKSLRGVALDVRWILVFDAPGNTSADTADLISSAKDLKITKAIYPGEPKQWGILQKNHGMDLIKGGWYHLLDDDNIVHPEFFKSIHSAIVNHPGKRAFSFGQLRRDFRGNLSSGPDKMKPGHIDNTMFVVSMDLIGSSRYDVKHAGIEDYHFFKSLYDKDPGSFVFLDEFICYYNYLRDFPEFEPKSNRALVTLADSNVSNFSELTHPSLKAYANKIGCDFHVINTRKYPGHNINYEKFQMADMLRYYERILYVDTDVLIRPSAPDIFARVEPGAFGGMDEAKHIVFWSEESIRGQFSPFGWSGKWNGRHLNAGVMVLDKTHLDIFREPVVTDIPYWDQPYINFRLQDSRWLVNELAPEYNFLVFHHYLSPGRLKETAHFLHFAGGTPTEGKISAIKEELASWK